VSLSEIVSAIIQIPRQHYELGNVSMYSLMAESGYLDSPQGISEEAILQGLQEHPEFISDWKTYSEDKRTTGWYFMEPSHGRYGIGFISSGEKDRIEPIQYTDEARACAAFIVRELGHIRVAVAEEEVRHKRQARD